VPTSYILAESGPAGPVWISAATGSRRVLPVKHGAATAFDPGWPHIMALSRPIAAQTVDVEPLRCAVDCGF